MLHYYEWLGNYKLISLNNNRTFLVGTNVDLMKFADLCHHEWGYLPNVVNACLVTEEFYEEYKQTYREKGFLMEGEEDGEGL